MHVDFTREPIVETIITPKDGCKLVIRSSKTAGQEEHFVDAVEVVSFGQALFFRSIERPKAFLVPVSDYEVLEVREARMVLKNVGIERTIKIGGGRDSSKPARETPEKTETVIQATPVPAPTENATAAATTVAPEAKGEARLDKKRDKRRNYRRRRGREEGEEETPAEEQNGQEKESAAKEPLAETSGEKKDPADQGQVLVPFISSLLPPPPTLISESIARYRKDALFKGAFFVKDSDEEQEVAIGGAHAESDEHHLAEDHSDEVLEALDMQNISLEPSAFGSFNSMEEEDDGIFYFDDKEVLKEEEKHAQNASESFEEQSNDLNNQEDTHEPEVPVVSEQDTDSEPPEHFNERV